MVNTLHAILTKANVRKKNAIKVHLAKNAVVNLTPWL